MFHDSRNHSIAVQRWFSRNRSAIMDYEVWNGGEWAVNLGLSSLNEKKVGHGISFFFIIFNIFSRFTDSAIFLAERLDLQRESLSNCCRPGRKHQNP